MKINRFKNFTNEGKETVKEFQQKRIDAFKIVKGELEELIELCEKGKEETAEYYKKNPNSYAIVIPTDAILDEIEDIKECMHIHPSYSEIITEALIWG